MITIAAIALIAIALVQLIQRDLRRAVARRRFRSQYADIRAAFGAFSAAIGAALIPAMRDAVHAAADLEQAMRRVSEAITTAEDR